MVNFVEAMYNRTELVRLHLRIAFLKICIAVRGKGEGNTASALYVLIQRLLDVFLAKRLGIVDCNNVCYLDFTTPCRDL